MRIAKTLVQQLDRKPSREKLTAPTQTDSVSVQLSYGQCSTENTTSNQNKHSVQIMTIDRFLSTRRKMLEMFYARTSLITIHHSRKQIWLTGKAGNNKQTKYTKLNVKDSFESQNYFGHFKDYSLQKPN